MNRVAGQIVSAIVRGRNIKFFVTDEHDEVQKYQFSGEFYEQYELDMIEKHVREGEVVLDIGSNTGNHAIYFERIFLAKKIYVIEPNPAVIPILNANLALNKLKYVDDSYIGIGFSDSYSYLMPLQEHGHNMGAQAFKPASEGSIRAVPGDALFQNVPITFIKIDVEGMELAVLRGLFKTIGFWRPAIFAEIEDRHFNEFESWFKQFDYKIVERNKRYPDRWNYLIKYT